MATLVEGIERVASVRQLLAGPGIATAVFGDTVRHAHYGARLALRQPRLPEDLEAADAVEMPHAVCHGAGPYPASPATQWRIGICGMGCVSRTGPSVTTLLVASGVQPSLSTSTTR